MYEKGLSRITQGHGDYVTIDGEWLGEEVAHVIYCQGKAKILNIIEALGLELRREAAIKRLVEAILSDIAKNANQLTVDVLGDWTQEVLTGGVPTPDEEAEARKEYEEVQKILK